MSTSLSEVPPGLVTKYSDHPLRALLLGHVVAVHFLGDTLVLYYGEGRKAYVKSSDGLLTVGDYEVPGC